MKNFRDFGYKNVRKGVLFRGESLYRLSKKDAKLFLEQCHINTVVDLRSPQERESKMDSALPGVTNIHLPLITMEEMGASSEKEAKQNILKTHKLPDMHHYYQRFVVVERKESWTGIFDLLLNHEEGGILFHCTAGKDRTGIVAAVILSVLGVDKDTIMKDYLLTNEHTVFPFAYRLFSLTFDKKTRQELKEYVLAKEDFIEAAFKEIDALYGGMTGFLMQCCGLDDDKIALLRKKYLVLEG